MVINANANRNVFVVVVEARERCFVLEWPARAELDRILFDQGK